LLVVGCCTRRHSRRPGLLAGGFRRRHLQFRRCPVLRLRGRPAPQPTGGGYRRQLL